MILGYADEALTKRRQLRRIPHVLAASFRLVWEADAALFIGSLLPQVVNAVVTGARLVVARDLIAALLVSGQGGDLGRVGVLLGLAVGLTLVSSASELVQDHRQQMLDAILERHTASALVGRIGAVDLSRFETPEFQDLLRRAHNAMYRMPPLVRAAVGFLRSLLLVSGIAVALYVLQPLLLALTLAGFIPIWLASLAGSHQMYGWWRSMTTNERKRHYVLGLFTEREYAKEIRAFGLTRYLGGLYEQLSNERLQELRRHLRKRLRFQIWSSGASNAVTLLTYGAIAYLLIDHRIGVAEAGAALIASQQLHSQLNGIAQYATHLYEGSLFLEDWEELASVAPSAAHVPPSTSPPPFRLIQFEGVTFRYPSAAHDGTRASLNAVSLEIRAGEVVALVGENGSGKTTLAKLLAGLYQPTEGRVLWDGIDTSTRDAAWVHQRVTVLFQDFARFMLTVRENIALGRVERLTDQPGVLAAAARAGAHAFIEEWPNGYETVLGPVFDGGKDASTGQWQRIALARAFFRDASLVILDEPTAALDARAEYDLFRHIRDLFRGRGVLLVSHRFSSVRGADRIYVLHEGVIVEHGTHDELIRMSGRYAELFALQASAYLPG